MECLKNNLTNVLNFLEENSDKIVPLIRKRKVLQLVEPPAITAVPASKKFQILENDHLVSIQSEEKFSTCSEILAWTW